MSFPNTFKASPFGRVIAVVVAVGVGAAFVALPDAEGYGGNGHHRHNRGACQRFFKEAFDCEGEKTNEKSLARFCCYVNALGNCRGHSQSSGTPVKGDKHTWKVLRKVLTEEETRILDGDHAARKTAVANVTQICDTPPGSKDMESLRQQHCKVMRDHYDTDTCKLKEVKPKEIPCPEGQKDCAEKAKGEQQAADDKLNQDKTNHQSAITGMDKVLGDALAGAIGYLEGIERYTAEKYPNDRRAMSRISRDRQLLARAIENSERGKPFTLTDASQAQLGGVKTFLSTAAMAKSLREYSQQGVEDINQTLGALGGIMNTTGKRVAHLGAVPDSTITGGDDQLASDATGTRKISRPGTGDDALPDSKRAAQLSGPDSAITGRKSQELASGKTDKLGAPSGVPSDVGGRDGAGKSGDAKTTATTGASKLRDMLAKRLRAGSGSAASQAESALGKSVDPEVLENASFERDLLRERREAAAEGNLPASATPGFSMRSAEDDPAIRSMLAEWNENVRQPASALAEMDGALLPMDSLSLFERVHQAHQTCVKRSCL